METKIVGIQSFFRVNGMCVPTVPSPIPADDPSKSADALYFHSHASKHLSMHRLQFVNVHFHMC
jgi:hypothetical protein